MRARPAPLAVKDADGDNGSVSGNTTVRAGCQRRDVGPVAVAVGGERARAEDVEAVGGAVGGEFWMGYAHASVDYVYVYSSGSDGG